MEFSLRSATNADANEVRELIFAVLEEYGLTPEPEGLDSDLRDLESAYIKSGGEFVLLIGDTNELLGCVGLFPLSDKRCEIRKMYLRKSSRGRGLGKYLLEFALAKAGERGFTRVELETAHVLKEAIGLYEAYGFKPHAADKQSQRCNRAYYLDL